MRGAWANAVLVARVTIADVARQKSFIAIVIAGVVILLMMRGCWDMNMVVNGQRVGGSALSTPLLKAVFTAIGAGAMFIAGLLSMRAFRRDREEGTLAFILSKPVARSHYLVGKMGGLWLLMTALMSLLHGVVFLIHYHHTGSLGAGCIAAMALTSLNVLFMVLAVALLGLWLPEIFAFLVACGVVGGAFIFDALARAARSEVVQSMWAQTSIQDETAWWKIVYVVWPKSGALQYGAASLLDGLALPPSGDLILPLVSIAGYCLALWLLILLRFGREEIG